MPPIVLLAYYCVAILVVSVLGGMLPGWLRLTHRWMECAVSLVSSGIPGAGVEIRLSTRRHPRCGPTATSVRTGCAAPVSRAASTSRAPSVVLVGRTGIHLTTRGKVQRASKPAAFLNDELTDVFHHSSDAAMASATT